MARQKAGKVTHRLPSSCVGPGNPWSSPRDGPPADPATLLDAFVLTTEGADYCYRGCKNHASGSRCGQVSYKSLRGVLQPTAPFAPLWKEPRAADAG